MKLAAVALASTLLLAGCQPAADDAAFGQRVRAYLLANPQVLEEAIRKLDETRAAEASAIQTKALAANRQALERDPRDPVLGNPDGAVTVVEFFDYRCGYCKAVAPEVLDLVAREGDVRLVLKELPILRDADTGRVGVSERAARVALAAEYQGRYLAVHRGLMAQRGALDDAAIARVVRTAGLDPDALAKAGAADAIDGHLAAVSRLAQSLGVNGTPAFIVGDRVVASADLAALRAAIAAARKS